MPLSDWGSSLLSFIIERFLKLARWQICALREGATGSTDLIGYCCTRIGPNTAPDFFQKLVKKKKKNKLVDILMFMLNITTFKCWLNFLNVGQKKHGSPEFSTSVLGWNNSMNKNNWKWRICWRRRNVIWSIEFVERSNGRLKIIWGWFLESFDMAGNLDISFTDKFLRDLTCNSWF